MPNDGKVCSFDCLYCEAGFNSQGRGTTGLPTKEEVEKELRQKLIVMQAEGVKPDVITFSGNGEPTLHPQFEDIIEITMRLRDEYAPESKVSVLTNSTRLLDSSVVRALKRVDNNIMKMDSAIDSTIRKLNRPASRRFTVERIKELMQPFADTSIIQTMLLRGIRRGVEIDNTTDAEIDALIEFYKAVKPREVMIYSLDRPTPAQYLNKLSKEELEGIAERIRQAGIKVQVN